MNYNWKQVGFITVVSLLLLTALLLSDQFQKSFAVSFGYLALQKSILIVSIILLSALYFQHNFQNTLTFRVVMAINISILIFGLTLYNYNLSRQWLHDALLNGLLGVCMLMVAYFKSS